MKFHLALCTCACACALALGISSCASTSTDALPVEPASTVYENEVPRCDNNWVTSAHYPAEAVRLGLTGNVSLAFSIDDSGKIQRVAVIHSAGRVLDANAALTARQVHCKVPSDWDESHGPMKRYRIGVTYNIVGLPAVAPNREDALQIGIGTVHVARTNGGLHMVDAGTGRLLGAFAGGDGSSIKKAVITNTTSEMENVDLEFVWVKERAPECRVKTRQAFKENRKHYENVILQCPDGVIRTVVFDVSGEY